jgi:hypothetical protein
MNQPPPQPQQVHALEADTLRAAAWPAGRHRGAAGTSGRAVTGAPALSSGATKL